MEYVDSPKFICDLADRLQAREEFRTALAQRVAATGVPFNLDTVLTVTREVLKTEGVDFESAMFNVGSAYLFGVAVGQGLIGKK